MQNHRPLRGLVHSILSLLLLFSVGCISEPPGQDIYQIEVERQRREHQQQQEEANRWRSEELSKARNEAKELLAKVSEFEADFEKIRSMIQMDQADAFYKLEHFQSQLSLDIKSGSLSKAIRRALHKSYFAGVGFVEIPTPAEETEAKDRFEKLKSEVNALYESVREPYAEKARQKAVAHLEDLRGTLGPGFLLTEAEWNKILNGLTTKEVASVIGAPDRVLYDQVYVYRSRVKSSSLNGKPRHLLLEEIDNLFFGSGKSRKGIFTVNTVEPGASPLLDK